MCINMAGVLVVRLKEERRVKTAERLGGGATRGKNPRGGPAEPPNLSPPPPMVYLYPSVPLAGCWGADLGFFTLFPLGAAECSLGCNGCTAVFVIASIALSSDPGGGGGEAALGALFAPCARPERPQTRPGAKSRAFSTRLAGLGGAGCWGARARGLSLSGGVPVALLSIAASLPAGEAILANGACYGRGGEALLSLP